MPNKQEDQKFDNPHPQGLFVEKSEYLISVLLHKASRTYRSYWQQVQCIGKIRSG